MSYVVELPNNSYKPIANTAWIRARLCTLQKGSTRLTAASVKVYQLLVHGWRFSLCTPASPTTKTCRHDIAEILLKVALNTKYKINKIKYMKVKVQSRDQFHVHYFVCELKNSNKALFHYFNM